MNRRTFLASVSVILALSVPSDAQTDVLAAAFSNLSRPNRISVQKRLFEGGFYRGRLDGAFGPGTRSALLKAAAFISDNSYGKVRFDLASAKGAADFLSALSTGKLDKYLWGEGDEAEGG